MSVADLFTAAISTGLGLGTMALAGLVAMAITVLMVTVGISILVLIFRSLQALNASLPRMLMVLMDECMR